MNIFAATLFLFALSLHGCVASTHQVPRHVPDLLSAYITLTDSNGVSRHVFHTGESFYVHCVIVNRTGYAQQSSSSYPGVRLELWWGSERLKTNAIWKTFEYRPREPKTLWPGETEVVKWSVIWTGSSSSKHGPVDAALSPGTYEIRAGSGGILRSLKIPSPQPVEVLITQ